MTELVTVRNAEVSAILLVRDAIVATRNRALFMTGAARFRDARALGGPTQEPSSLRANIAREAQRCNSAASHDLDG